MRVSASALWKRYGQIWNRVNMLDRLLLLFGLQRVRKEQPRTDGLEVTVNEFTKGLGYAAVLGPFGKGPYGETPRDEEVKP